MLSVKAIFFFPCLCLDDSSHSSPCTVDEIRKCCAVISLCAAAALQPLSYTVNCSVSCVVHSQVDNSITLVKTKLREQAKVSMIQALCMLWGTVAFEGSIVSRL